MIFSGIQKLKELHRIDILCKIGMVSTSGYYKWSQRSLQDSKDVPLIEKIRGLQKKHKCTYGYRKITEVLNKDLNNRFNSKKVHRIMRENDLLSVIKRKKKWHGRSSGEPKENIVNRNFISDAPSKKLVTDITEVKMFNKKIYLSTILDLYNNEVISYRIGRFNTLGLVSDTISDLIKKNGDYLNGSIFHSDQGFQYTHELTKKKLKENGIIQSMSRKGNPLDNACIESFFGVMKSEILHNKKLKYKSMNHFEEELVNWIEYYNYERIQKRLNYLSPIEYKKAT